MKRLIGFLTVLCIVCCLCICSDAADDTTGPEMVNFRIVEKGQSLTAGDTMHVQVKFEDESGIRIVQGMTSEPEGTYAAFQYNSSKDLWEWSYTITETVLNGHLSLSVWAYDNVGNSSGILYPEDYVVITGCSDDTTGPEMVSFRIVEKGKSLTAGDIMHVQVKFTDVSGIRIVQGMTSEPEGIYAAFQYNSSKELWEWSYTITETVLNGQLSLSVWAYDNVGNSSGILYPEDYVVITGCSDDTTGPEMVSFKILEQGKTLTAGDTMHVQVKFADESGIRIVQGMTTGPEGHYAGFQYNENKDIWEWSYTFDEYTLDGHFGIKSIWAYDKVGNSSGILSPDGYVVFSDPFNRHLIIPKKTTKIEAEAFLGDAMVVVTIQEGCKTIGEKAFANCKSLWRIYIPSSVVNIADNFLDGSTRAEICCKQGSMAERWAQSHDWPVKYE